MAGESALVVDHSPVNLRLAELLLRKDEFQVQAAHDAEEALFLLCGARPDVMLVNVQLPGMDGLELARCVKSDPNTRDIVVLALTASAAEAEQSAALAAGCDGAIPAPLDPSTLGKTVREYMDRRNAPPVEQTPSLFGEWALTDHELESLRRRFLEDGMAKTRRLLDSAGPAFDAPTASYLLRRWVEAAGALGYAEIAESARRAEEFAQRPRPDAARLREAFGNLLCAFSTPRDAASDPLPDWLISAFSGKRMGLTAFRPEEAERLCAALDRAGARPRLFEAGESTDSQPVQDCSLMMLEVREETLGSRWLAPDSPPPGRPLILAGSRKQIMELGAAAQARASDFLIDGWQPEEALLRCGLALARADARALAAIAEDAPQPAPTIAPRAASGPPEILIADDDAIVRSLVRGTLENYGMSCLVAADGPEALEIIRSRRPDAALLDINMPGMDGFLVLAAIREEKIGVPVILLTGRAHENDISRGFTLGADDYLVKPFGNVELIARLKRLIRR